MQPAKWQARLMASIHLHIPAQIIRSGAAMHASNHDSIFPEATTSTGEERVRAFTQPDNRR